MKRIWDFPGNTILVQATALALMLAFARNSAAAPPADDCCGGRPGPVASGAGPQRTTEPVSRPALPGTVNRTVPAVEAPGAALEFSSPPTVDEFFRCRLFEEPLLPVGGVPAAAESAALAAALRGYAQRQAPDDFSSLDNFLARHPSSPWRAALLANLGLEAYRTGRYSRTISSWSEAWRLAKDAKAPSEIVDAVFELLHKHAGGVPSPDDLTLLVLRG